MRRNPLGKDKAMRSGFAAFCETLQQVACYTPVAVCVVGLMTIVGYGVISGCAMLDKVTGTHVVGLLFGLTFGPLGIVTAVCGPVALLQRIRAARGLSPHPAPSQPVADLPARMGQAALRASATPRCKELV
jgi:hypothetical protein